MNKFLKFFKSLPGKLVLGIVLGILAGLVMPRSIIVIVVTIKYFLNQFINYCVPLIVVGFIAPSIAKLGKNATKLLVVAILIAYLSSFFASLMSTGAGYAIIPHLHISTDMSGIRELPDVAFEIDLPQIFPVMSALVLSVLLGLATVWTKSKLFTDLLQDFQNIVLEVVKRVIIPVLPLFIGVTFCSLAWEGVITKELPVFVLVIGIVLIGHFIWLAVLYGTATLYSGHSGLEVLKHYGPAYLTAVGTMSSAATLAVALECANKSENLRKDIIEFGIPLFANIHLCGSVLTEVFFAMTVSMVLYGQIPPLGSMLLFCVLLGMFAVGAPGVPGGTVMATLGLFTSVLNFESEGIAIMLAVFALQDSFGTACNVTGDGALTLMLTGFAEKHGITEEEKEEQPAAQPEA